MPEPVRQQEDYSFSSLYLELAPALHVWASLRIRPELRGYCEATDLLQEVWCRAYAIRERFDPQQAQFRPWLFRVAKNVLLEVARKARQVGRVHPSDGRTSRILQLEGVADEITSVTRQVARDDTLRAFHEEIAALPDGERELVLHVGLEGMSYADVAPRLGLNPEAVKKRWQRLRTKLEARGLPATLLEH